MGWWLTKQPLLQTWRHIRTHVLPNLRHLPASRFRRCGACRKFTLIVALDADEEYQLCVRCRATLRYEMLAMYLREAYPDLSTLDVLELDFHSPLRPLLESARSYRPSFYRSGLKLGARRADGVECQDITQLTLPDSSLDLIVSSEVLEHVADFEAALRESARVLRPDGAHVFTVPPSPKTARRAAFEQGKLVHLISPPEYHLDPLSPEGVLCFWNFGPDMPGIFSSDQVTIRQVAGPRGSRGRVIWEARKRMHSM
jgi:SAM-dependent methyltransferase